jgi:hypothetical protein
MCFMVLMCFTASNSTQTIMAVCMKFWHVEFPGALGGLVVSVLATEPTGYSVAGSSPTEDGGFLRVIKIHRAHFLRRGSKAVGPMS